MSKSLGCTKPDSANSSPFELANVAAYQAWRAQKLAGIPGSVDDLDVVIENGNSVSQTEAQKILSLCARCNMAVYRMRSGDYSDKEAVRALAEKVGLEHLDKNLRADEDAITSVRVVEQAGGKNYIPYTARGLNWHTDGYYNRLDQQVRGVVMHCVSQSASGGENYLLDHELVYLQIRDSDPELVAALSEADVMTVPANDESGNNARSVQTGPVFSVDAKTGALHMRYTARTKSILWKDDKRTRAAVASLKSLMGEESPYAFRVRLEPGQGIICNNVLHGRTTFTDGTNDKRLLYRGRYYDRVRETDTRKQGTG